MRVHLLFTAFLALLSLVGGASSHSVSIPSHDRIPGGRGLPIIVVHGGAGSIGPEDEINKNNGTKAAIRTGYQVLMEGGTPMEAVVAAIKVPSIKSLCRGHNHV